MGRTLLSHRSILKFTPKSQSAQHIAVKKNKLKKYVRKSKTNKSVEKWLQDDKSDKLNTTTNSLRLKSQSQNRQNIKKSDAKNGNEKIP